MMETQRIVYETVNAVREVVGSTSKAVSFVYEII